MTLRNADLHRQGQRLENTHTYLKHAEVKRKTQRAKSRTTVATLRRATSNQEPKVWYVYENRLAQFQTKRATCGPQQEQKGRKRENK